MFSRKLPPPSQPIPGGRRRGLLNLNLKGVVSKKRRFKGRFNPLKKKRREEEGGETLPVNREVFHKAEIDFGNSTLAILVCSTVANLTLANSILGNSTLAQIGVLVV